MPVAHDLRFVFVHIPKTGGTSIERALGLFGSWRVEDRERLFGQVQSADLLALGLGTRYLQHLTAAEIRAVEPRVWGQHYHWFSVVRNPWDRILSTYLNPDPDLVEQARSGGIDLVGLELAEFLRRTEGVQHVHLRSQHEFVLGASRTAQMTIGRFESLAEDFRRACERLQVDRTLPHANAATARGGRAYREFYTPRTAAAVAARYARDIELFGYRY